MDIQVRGTFHRHTYWTGKNSALRQKKSLLSRIAAVMQKIQRMRKEHGVVVGAGRRWDLFWFLWDSKIILLNILQVFEKDDYRNLRFTNSRRLVNKNWGINLIAEIPPKECTERVVSCDGGDGPLGHPKVYINLVR